MLSHKLGMIYNNIVLIITIVILYACDGIDGTGVNSDSEASLKPSMKFLSGTAAQGAPIKNSIVTVKGSAGKIATGTTDDVGKFSIEFYDLKAPYLLKVKRRKNVDLYGLTSDLSNVNIHPYTDLTIRNWFAVHGYSIDDIFSDNLALVQLPTSENIKLIENSIRDILGSSEMTIRNRMFSFENTLNLKAYNDPFDADNTGFDYYLDYSDVIIRNNKINVTIIDPVNFIESKLISDVNLDADFTLPDITAPSKPTNFQAIATGGTGYNVVLSWGTSIDDRGIKYYQLYKNGARDSTTPFRHWIEKSSQKNTLNCYSITAIDGSDNESIPTPEICVLNTIITDTMAPIAIRDLTANAVGSAVIQLNWTAPTAPDVLSYQIYSNTAGTNFRRIATIQDTRYLDFLTKPLEKTCYTVFARDAANNISKVSNEVCATVANDKLPPSTTTNILGAMYNTVQIVRLKCDDGLFDTGCSTIYYTLDGTVPDNKSLIYSGPIVINSTTTLRYFSVDIAGNSESSTKPDNSQSYIIKSNTDRLIPGLEFTSSSYKVSENAGTAIINVRRNGDKSGEVSVDYSITSASATENEDYSSVTGTLVWPDNYSAPRKIIIPIRKDVLKEVDETFTLRLSNPTTNTTLATNSISTVTITDVPCNGILNTNIVVDTIITEPCTIVSGDLQVNNNVNLTISPGSTLIFQSGSGLNINSGGNLIASGSQLKPIVFTAFSPQPGYWKGIHFINTNRKNNVLNHSTVEYGGLGGNGNVHLYLQSSVTIKNSTLSHSSNYGLQVSKNAKVKEFNNNKLYSNVLNPVQIDISGTSWLNSTSTYSGNGIDSIEVIGSVLLENGIMPLEKTYWQALDVAYSVADIFVGYMDEISPDLIIAPGTIIKFRANGKLTVNSTKFTAIGTKERPIIFTADSANPVPGFWAGIEFIDSFVMTMRGIENKFSFVTVEYAGGINAEGTANIILQTNSVVTIEDSTINNSASNGILVNSSNGAVLTQTRNVFSNIESKVNVLNR